MLIVQCCCVFFFIDDMLRKFHCNGLLFFFCQQLWKSSAIGSPYGTSRKHPTWYSGLQQLRPVASEPVANTGPSMWHRGQCPGPQFSCPQGGPRRQLPLLQGPHVTERDEHRVHISDPQPNRVRTAPFILLHGTLVLAARRYHQLLDCCQLPSDAAHYWPLHPDFRGNPL